MTDHFDWDSQDVLLCRLQVDVHKAQITGTLCFCELGMAQQLCATRLLSALPRGPGELTERLLEHSVTAATVVTPSTPFSASQSVTARRPVGMVCNRAHGVAVPCPGGTDDCWQ